MENLQVKVLKVEAMNGVEVGGALGRNSIRWYQMDLLTFDTHIT